MANTYKVTDYKTGRTMRVTGESPPTEQELEEIFSQFGIEREKTFGEKARGAFDATANIITSGMAQPVGGLFGLANLAINQDPKMASDRAIEMRDKVTYQPNELGQEYLQSIAGAPVIKQIGETSQAAGDYAGRKTMELTGSPALASVASGALDATGTALSAFIPGGIAARQAHGLPNVAREGAKAQVQGAGARVEDLADSSTISAIRSGNKKRILETIDPDPEFYKALDELGITSEPLASFASRNPQFRGIEQSFAALPNSPQNAQALNFAKDVSNIAHAILETAEGAGESVATSNKWRAASMKTIDRIGNAENQAYNAMNSVVDKRAIAEPQKTLNLLNSYTENLPLGINDRNAPAILRQAYKALQPQRTKTLTPDGQEMDIDVPANYESMDTLRKKIGAAAFNNEGPFKDAEKGLLKKLYGELTDDLNAMAEKQGLVDEVKAAKLLTQQRKQIENQMQTLLGKQLQSDIIPIVQGGIKGLRKGGAQRYKQIMDSIPSKDDRTELILTAIDDMFTKTKGGEKSQFGTTDYINWYNETLGKKGVRDILARDLPENVLAGLDNLAKISEGMARATVQRIPTGVVNSVLNDSTGILARMVGRVSDSKAGQVAGRAGEIASNAAGYVPGVDATVSAIGSILRSKTTRAEKTSELLADPEFSNMIKRAVAAGARQGEMVRQAGKRLNQNANYKAWQQTLTESEKAKLASVGVAAFLLNQEESQ